MIDQHKLQRYEELEAGFIIGDLDDAETKEWEELANIYGSEADFSLELTVSAVEAELLDYEDVVVPEKLMAALNAGKAPFISDNVSEGNVEGDLIRPSLSVWQRVIGSSQAAWAVAAVLALLLVINSFLPKPETSTDTPVVLVPSVEEARDQLVSNASDLVELDFGGVKQYEGMTGKVIWSDKLQEGYMTFTNLAVNDPAKKQYQLWIVDPARDEKPVDGGVFDIPSGAGTVIIPIRNPLAVNDPAAFVITLEQPGGVVVSKQEVVVALAAKS